MSKSKKSIVKDQQAEMDDLILQREELYMPVIQIYKEYPQIREDHLDQVSQVMQSVEFFKSCCPESTTLIEFTKLCCQNLQYEFFPQAAPVFHVDEQGDKFYIVLQGRAGVYIKRNQQQLDADEEAYLAIQQKFKERNSIDVNNFVDDKTKLFERFIKKQKGKPPKVIESELLLLRSGDFDRCFTSTGVCKFMCVAQKYSGQYFGEMALTNDKPRAASIIALTDLIVLSLSKANYKKVFEQNIKREQQKIDYFMKLFPQMTKFKMSKLIVYFSQMKFPANFIIWRQGDDVDGFLLLKDGEAQLIQNVEVQRQSSQPKPENQQSILGQSRKEPRDTKQQIIIADLTSGCFVGDNDVLLGHERREYTVKTLQQCAAFFLSSENFSMVKKSFPEFVTGLQSIQQRSSSLIRSRIEEIVRTKSTLLSMKKIEGLSAVERRYAYEFEERPDYSESPIIRSTLQKKLTKQQMVEQNQTIMVQHTKLDEVKGENEEFNMLRMAGDNFQKCLLIRVEKQFEKFQPAKPKGKTPYFSRSSKDIKDLMEQIRRYQLPQLSTHKDSVSFRASQGDEKEEVPFFQIKAKTRIVNPVVQQKVDYIRSQMGVQQHGGGRKKASMTMNPRQQIKSTESASGFLLTDAVVQYHPLHSNQNKKWNLKRTKTQQRVPVYEPLDQLSLKA